MYTIWIDATCKPRKISKNKQDKVGHSSIGFIVKKNNIIIDRKSKYVGVLNNNQAEYEAFLEAILYVIDNDIREVSFYTDSNLIQKQMTGKYSCYAENILPYYEKAISLLQLIPTHCVKWVSRKSNREADKLARNFLDDFLNNMEL
jgi:ribonuclease HI